MPCSNNGLKLLLKLRNKTTKVSSEREITVKWERRYGSVAPCQVWMCGGTLLIVTCSHVGHVFRKATPYSFPGGTGHIINHNNARLADVWMDDWHNFFYHISPGSVRQMAASVRVCMLNFCMLFFFPSIPILLIAGIVDLVTYSM